MTEIYHIMMTQDFIHVSAILPGTITKVIVSYCQVGMPQTSCAVGPYIGNVIVLSEVTGLGGLGLLGWRRKRKVQAVA